MEHVSSDSLPQFSSNYSPVPLSPRNFENDADFISEVNSVQIQSVGKSLDVELEAPLFVKKHSRKAVMFLRTYSEMNIPVTYLKPAKWDSFTIAQQKKILQAWKELPGTLLSIFAINLSYAINVSYYTENKKDEFSNSIQSTSVVSITRADAQTSKVVNASALANEESLLA